MLCGGLNKATTAPKTASSGTRQGGNKARHPSVTLRVPPPRGAQGGAGSIPWDEFAREWSRQTEPRLHHPFEDLPVVVDGPAIDPVYGIDEFVD